MTTPYYDMHCHLDFAPNAAEVERALSAQGAGAFAVSVLPDSGSVNAQNTQAGPCSLVKWGVGLHPWWIASGQAGDHELEALCEAIPHNIYIGEVGLDFGKAHGQRTEEQTQAFSTIAHACAQKGGRVLSIHAVRAAHCALDALEAAGTLDNCTCIFHWFSDSSDALHRAVRAGCYFSVGQLMLRSARGREYARVVPAHKLLFETDEPPAGMPYSVDAMQNQLAQTCAQVAQLRAVSVESLGKQVAHTSRTLLGREHDVCR